MTAKSTGDGDETHVDTMVERIRVAQEESWRTLRYVDENSTEAWNSFEKLFVDLNPIVAEGEDVVGSSANQGQSSAAVAGIPNLESSMSNGQYLDHIGAPRDRPKLNKTKRKRSTKKEVTEEDGDGSSLTLSDDSDDDVVVVDGTGA